LLRGGSAMAVRGRGFAVGRGGTAATPFGGPWSGKQNVWLDPSVHATYTVRV
jgi:hypothetical protein